QEGRTPIGVAVESGAVEGVRALLAAGTSLWSEGGGINLLKLAEGALARCAARERAGFEGTMAILDAALREDFRRAAESGDVAALGHLLRAYPEYRDAPTFGFAPIHWAAARGQTGVLALLREHGVDLG